MIKKLQEGHWPIFLLSSLSSVTNLLLPIFLVRILTPSEMGLYKIFFIHLTAIPFFFLLGAPVHSVYYWIGKEKEQREAYLQASWQLTFFLSLLVLILGLPLSGLLSNWLNFPLKYTILMIYSGFLMMISSHYAEIKTAQGYRVRGSLFHTSFEVVKAFFFIILAYLTKNIYYIFLSYAFIYSLKLLLALYYGQKEKTQSFNLIPEKLKEVFLYCLPISVSGLLGFFVDKIDLLILSSELSPKDFAFYSMGCLIIPPLIILDMSVQKVLIPKLSNLYTEKKFSLAAEHFRKAISDTSFLIIPSIFGLIVFARPIVSFLYTDNYLQSAVFLKIFALGYLQYIIPHDAVFRATGKSQWILKIYLLTGPLSIIIVYFAAKNHGALMALSYAIALKFLPKFLGLLYSKKIMNWSWKELFPYKRLALFTSLSLFLSIISYSLRPLFNSESQWFYILSPLFAVIYLLLLYRTKRSKK